MKLHYDGFKFDIAVTRRFDTIVDYSEDGVDPLYLHHIIGVEATISDNVEPLIAMALRNPVAGQAVGPGKAALNQIVLPARKQLVIFDDAGREVLRSPKQGFATDSKNGPTPLAFNIYRVTGSRTLVCYFEIETWEPWDCQTRDVSVLSHRWEAHEDVDEQYFRTRTISGRAVFDTGRLLLNGRVPDDFRARLFHPIPPNHQRLGVKVTAESAGNAVRYTIIDKQMPLSIGRNHNIAKIRGWYKQGFTDESWFGFANRFNSVIIECWGTPLCSRQELINACMKSAIPYGFPHLLNPENLNPGFSAELEVDLFDKHVRFRAAYMNNGSFARNVLNEKGIGNIRITPPGIQIALDRLRDQLPPPGQVIEEGNGRFNLYKNFPDGRLPEGPRRGGSVEAAADAWKKGTYVFQPDTDVNPGPWSDAYPIGHLEKLVAQAINGVCATPTNPADRKAADNLTYIFS